MSKKLLLLTLQMFSSTGGIQKMTRTLAYSLSQLAAENDWTFDAFSAYDADGDLMTQYLPAQHFKGFSIRRVPFVIDTLKEGRKADVVILSHINLAIVGLLIKLINPDCKIWLIAHGIEVWRPLSAVQRRMIAGCDKIICVSEFTKHQMMRLHGTDDSNSVVLNNAVDPFMDLPESFEKPAALMEKYNLREHEPVIYTLTRLASTEQYKGYEQVIRVLGRLKTQYPGLKYILSGPYDLAEELRINTLIDEFDVSGSVILTGFIDEKDLPDHFLLADVFVLPSQKEGFGIVFIEAMACGLPVICGNTDGSNDAVRNMEYCQAIDPQNLDELERAIADRLVATPATLSQRKALQGKCLSYFSEHAYRDHLRELLIT